MAAARPAQEIIEHLQNHPAAEASRQPAGARSDLLQRGSSSASTLGAADLDEDTELAAAEHQDTHEDIEDLQREATQRQHAEVPDCRVHVFFNCLPAIDDRAACIVIEVLDNEAKLPFDSIDAIAAVFECAFVCLTDPHERTVLVYRDTAAYVRQWHQLASHRSVVGADRYFNGTCISPKAAADHVPVLLATAPLFTSQTRAEIHPHEKLR